MKLFLLIAILGLISTPSFAQMNYIITPKKPVAQTSQQATPTTADTPQSRVWDKYKKLAGDTPPPAQTAPPSPAPKTSTPKPTGMRAILQQYNASKASQSHMRTLTIQKPKLPQKPEVKKP